MYVDTMQQIFNNTTKVMVDNKSSNNLLYLPLDQLAKRAAPAPAPGSSAAPVQPNVPASSPSRTHNCPAETAAFNTGRESAYFRSFIPHFEIRTER